MLDAIIYMFIGILEGFIIVLIVSVVAALLLAPPLLVLFGILSPIALLITAFAVLCALVSRKYGVY